MYLAKLVWRLSSTAFNYLEIYYATLSAIEKIALKFLFKERSVISLYSHKVLELQQKLRFTHNNGDHVIVLCELDSNNAHLSFNQRAQYFIDKDIPDFELYKDFVKFLYENILEDLGSKKLSEKSSNEIARLLFPVLMEALYAGVNMKDYNEQYSKGPKMMTLEASSLDNDFARAKQLVNGLPTLSYVIEEKIIADSTYSRVSKKLQIEKGVGTYIAAKKFENKNLDQQKREFNIHKQLSHHPNIAQVLSYCEATQEMFMVYYQLSSLDNVIKNLQFNHEIRFTISYGCAWGVKYLHDDKDIIHGDLKPENILIDNDHGKLIPKITDFGESFYKTETPQGSFTKTFAAPEILKANKEEQLKNQNGKSSYPQTQNSDIYSLLLILFCIIVKKITPPSPDQYLKDNETFKGYTEAVLQNIKQCSSHEQYNLFIANSLKFNAAERPTAEKVLEAIAAAAHKL